MAIVGALRAFGGVVVQRGLGRLLGLPAPARVTVGDARLARHNAVTPTKARTTV